MTEADAAVFELFGRALEEQPADLEAWLQVHCVDAEQRRRVRLLLEHDREASSDQGFLKSPVLRPGECEPLPAPERIGAFRIVREIGRGGMGTVYEAVQDRPSRTVALKMIRPEHSSAAVLKRFEQEAEVLGRLDHQGIAHIYEAGVATREESLVWGGYPWFAMEYVHGERLDEWAARSKPTIRERLDVLARIADALHHAHQKGVIHRDIKPANILVSKEGDPKLMDFGIARLVDDSQRSAGFETGTGRLIGTLAYMSPEQIEGHPDHIDVRTDVYSLGVVAYELFASRLPHDTTNRSLPATARAIQEQMPESIGRISPELRGDIETVVMTAMAKDPDRRYASASEFGADLRRILGSQPISARPPSALYHLRCFARRHRALVSVSGLLLAGLVASLVVVSVFALRLNDQAMELDRRAQVAERESSRVVAISEFLERTLTAADPFADYAAAPQTTVGELLARAEPWLDTSFADAPFAEAAARSIVGRTYKGLGGFVDAERQIRAAVERLDEADASVFEDRDRIRQAGLLTEHAVVLMHLDRTTEALAQLDRSQALASAIDRVPDREASVRLGNAGWVLRRAGKFEEAKGAMRLSIQAAERAGSAADRDRAFTLANLAGLHTDLGELAEAAERYAESELIVVRLYGEDHPYLGVLSNSIGRLKLEMGDLEGATSAFSNALRRLSATVGVQHPRTLTVLNNLAYVQSEAGDYAASEQFYRDALDGLASVYGTAHREYRSTLRNYAWLLWEMERFWEASEAWAEVAAGFQAESGEGLLLGLMYEVYAAALAVMAEPTDERIERLVWAFDRQIEAVDVSEPQAQSGLRQVVAALERAGREDLLERYRAMLIAQSGQ